MAAEVGGGESRGKKGKKKRGKKGNPYIDMTPMVDLGFLLLTFFVLTTTMSTPTTMPVVVPPKIDEQQKEQIDEPKIAASKVLHLILDEDNKIYWYQGSEEDVENAEGTSIELNQTGYSANGIRAVVKEIRQKVAQKWGKPDELIILIKVTDKAKYKNFVDILDEMNILEQKKYMLVEPSEEELKMVDEYKKSRGE